MFIKSIKMNNFRQFIGENKIDFSNNKDKNVTIILGENSFGKTTILNAIKWCFFNIPKDGENVNNLLNKKLLNNRKDISLYVTIEVETEDNLYVYSRTVSFSFKNKNSIYKKYKSTVYYQKDNDMVPMDSNIEEHVIRFIPKELRNFFFLDNESINSITEERKLKESIKSLSGLNIYNNAIEHIGHERKKSLIKLISDNIIELTEKNKTNEDYKNDSKLSLLKNEINDYEIRKEQLLIEKNDLIKETEAYKKNIEIHNKKKNEFSKDIEKNHKQLNTFTTEKKIKEQNLKEEKSKLYDILSIKNGQRKIVEFCEPVEDFLSMLNEYKCQCQTYLPVEIIDNIIKSGECICGKKIDKGSVYYKNLMNFKEECKKKNKLFLKEDKIKTDKKKFLDYYEDNYKKDSLSKYSRVIGLYSDIDDLDSKINDLIKQSDSYKEYEDIKNTLNEFNEQLAQKEKFLKNNETEINCLEKDIIKKHNEIDKITERMERTKKLTKMKKIICKTKDLIVKEKLKNEVKVKDILEEKVSNCFNELYSGNREVVIDNDYYVKLKAKDSLSNSYDTDISRGSETIKNFAFVTGMILMAKQKICTDLKFEQNEKYPLVLDAPFSNIDEEHIKNVCENMPKLIDQIVFMMMNRDWKFAKDKLKENISKVYKIIKLNELESKIEVSNDEL